MNRLSTVVLVLGSVLSFVACGSETTITISGSVLILQEQNFSRTGSNCTGVDALSSLREDATVTIDDRTATLSRGTITGHTSSESG